MDPPSRTFVPNSQPPATANGGGNGRVEQVQQQVEDVKTVMSENVTRILERGERLDNLDQQSAALQESAQTFTHTSRQVHRAFWLRNMKWTIIFAVFMGILSLMVVLIILHMLKVI